MSNPTHGPDVASARETLSRNDLISHIQKLEVRVRELEAERDSLRRRAESRLRASEERYRVLFDSIDRGFCIIQVLFDHQDRPFDYRFIEVNAAFEAQTGLEDAVGRTARELRPELEEHWFELYGRVAWTGEPMRFENPAASMERWFDVYACRIGEPEERLVALLFNDITARKEMEAERDRLQDRLASDLEAMRRLHALSTRLVKATELPAMLEEILEATITLQGADFGNIQLYDRETRSLRIVVQRGFSQEFLDTFRVVDADDDSACGRALRRKERVMIEDVQRDPGYAPFRGIAERSGYRAVQSTPMVGPDGSTIGMLSTHFREPHRPPERYLHLTDLYLRLAAELISRHRGEEALREAKEAAERANNAKSQFLSTMSHELRTPLTAVMGISDLLTTEIVGPMNAKQKEFVSRMKASASHLVAIIDEILSYSRSEAGKEEAHIDEVDVAEIARGVLEMFTTEAGTRGLALRLHGADEQVVGLTDGGKVRQILANLVGNALKYTQAGAVDVELDAGADSLELCVRDTGPGIPAERLEEIFEPFEQLDQSGTNDGAGLGLAICRRLARLLGGDVTVESEPGQGSAFTLRLPRRG